jgi:hypothetical protein
MRTIEKDELMSMSISARGYIDHIYLHWSAGHYNQSHTDKYHICIDKDGTMYTDVDLFTEHRDHTYMRNSRAIGITLNGCFDAINPSNMGTEPPTKQQIYALSWLVALLCVQIGIPLDIQHVMTHAEAADNKDGMDLCYDDPTPYPNNTYGPDSTCERWDLWVLRENEQPWSGGDNIRGNARYIAHTEWGIDI